jgi:hypothetical protein
VEERGRMDGGRNNEKEKGLREGKKCENEKEVGRERRKDAERGRTGKGGGGSQVHLNKRH